jgi:hypothetical protein
MSFTRTSHDPLDSSIGTAARVEAQARDPASPPTSTATRDHRARSPIGRSPLRHSIMSTGKTFTILSTHAPLVEVSGDGPTFDIGGGLAIPDGAATTARVNLRNASVRRWRVDAPPTVETAVVVTDSPYGAFVGVRRCVGAPELPSWWRHLSVAQWPRLRSALKRRAPSVLALWHLFTDDMLVQAWRDVGDDTSNLARARGGDLIVINFVSPARRGHA